MDVSVSSKQDGDILHLEAVGSVFDLDAYKDLTRRYLAEIEKHDLKKILADESRVEWAKSLLLKSDIVNYYVEQMPETMKQWKIACVVDEASFEIVKFWECQANQNGFHCKAFTSLNEAREFLRE